MKLSFVEKISKTTLITVIQIISSIIFIPLFVEKFSIADYGYYSYSAIIQIFLTIPEQGIVLRYIKKNMNEKILIINSYFWILSSVFVFILLFILFKRNISYLAILALSLNSTLVIFLDRKSVV